MDEKTGTVTQLAIDKQKNVYEKHPQTGETIKGFKFPYWIEAIELCKKACQEIPVMVYVGWDVAFTENGPLSIEANNMPGHDALPQMPLQAPDKIGFLPTLRQYVKGI